ncbi:unnamed protein product [Phaedon cochleariae]|uniref:AAA+ ATPase domain-containing protein n=1 Tax=Phaedon cochleariae TaxID=80249 RepID=A0A9P0DVF8_PHACE|nr:unnamed protein product [Phaedon cochleariae]
MSQEETDITLNPYFSAIECFENLESLFHKQIVDFSKIKHELQNSYNKIETIMITEDLNCPFFVDLFQLKAQIIELIKLVETKMKPPQLNPHQPDIPKKSHQNKQDTEKLLNFVESTIETPRINGLTEIAGLWEAKKLLKSLLVLPRSQPQLFMNRKASNSVLLFGPPGTGKTHLVHALAYESRAVLHCVSAGNIVSPLIGQSEKNVQFLFNHLRSSSNFSMLFIDEVDGFCKRRTDSEHEHSRRMKTELMCQISRMEENSNMFLICATNCPWDLDPAFLRRFQKRVYVPLPNRSERHDLFRLFTKHNDIEISSNHWEYLIDKTEGFSGSDISDLIQQALNIPILELEDTKIWKNCPDEFYEPVTTADDFNLEEIICCELSDLPACSVRARKVQPLDLINCLDSITVTVSKVDIKRYEVFNMK